MNSPRNPTSAARRFLVTPAFLLTFVLVLTPWGLPAAEKGDSGRIEALLVHARQALNQNHLTLPAGDNAVAYAQRVLDLAPKHPEALEILHQVVARYEALGLGVIDRAEALRRAELEKARLYQERGGRIAQRYRLPAEGLERLKEQLAGESGRAGSQASAREALTGVVARYATLSEAALKDGNLVEAQRYRDLAQDLVQAYRLKGSSLQRLSTRLESTQGAKAIVTDQEKERESTSAPSSNSKQAIFLPPAF